MWLHCTLQNAAENVAAYSAPVTRGNLQLGVEQSVSPAVQHELCLVLEVWDLGVILFTGIQTKSWRRKSTLNGTWSNPMFCALFPETAVFSAKWLWHSAPIFINCPGEGYEGGSGGSLMGDAGDVGSWAATGQLWMHAVRHHKSRWLQVVFVKLDVNMVTLPHYVCRMPYTNYLLIHFLHLVFGVLGATLPDDKIVSHAYSGVYSCLRPSCGCDDAAKWYRCDAGSTLSHPNLWCITSPIVDYIIFDFDWKSMSSKWKAMETTHSHRVTFSWPTDPTGCGKRTEKERSEAAGASSSGTEVEQTVCSI